MKLDCMVQYIISHKITYDYEKISLFELCNIFTYNLKNSLEYIQNYSDELLTNDKQRNNKQKNGGKL